MKSAEAVGPSKNASQDWSAGLMRRLRPSLVISTWRTFGGKVMDFGKRTAWLRLVVNTVERVTLLLHFSTPGISHWYIRNRPAFINADGAALQRMARQSRSFPSDRALERRARGSSLYRS